MNMNALGIQGVIIDPEIQGGRPVVETGIPIYLILDMLAQGFTQQEMLDDYGVTAEHIQISLRFAAAHIGQVNADAA
ncbi:MAG: DUF433 domain-containing protein [Ktedonobacterales bacterium]|nr:DUF433 domain-containing protein [Ktedonobacterales bacterium]